MKKLKLKKWVKVILLLIIVLIVLLKINIKLDKDFIENCMNQGFSRSYCEVHK